MSIAPQLMLLIDGRTRRYLPVYDAIPLGPEPVDFGRTDWLVYILGAAQPQSVRVFPPPVYTTHSDTDRGCIWREDGHQVPMGAREQFIQSMVSDAETVALSPPRPDLALPVFVGSDPTLQPYQVDVVIQFSVRWLQELPSVRIQQYVIDYACPGGPVPITAGVYIPVTVGHTRTWHEAVLRLTTDLGNGRFAAAILSADPDLHAEHEAVIRSTGEGRTGRSVRLDPLTAAIATVLEAGGRRPVDTDAHATARLRERGPELPIQCSTCGRRASPDSLTPDQLETISFWTELLPYTREQPMLRRVLEMYRRHPEARGKATNKLAAILGDPEARRQWLLTGETLGEMPDPRPATYRRDLERWTDGDTELADFLERGWCNPEKRLQWLEERAGIWSGRLRGRQITCPACGKGPLVFAVGGRIPISEP